MGFAAAVVARFARGATLQKSTTSREESVLALGRVFSYFTLANPEMSHKTQAPGARPRGAQKTNNQFPQRLQFRNAYRSAALTVPQRLHFRSAYSSAALTVGSVYSRPPVRNVYSPQCLQFCLLTSAPARPRWVFLILFAILSI